MRKSTRIFLDIFCWVFIAAMIVFFADWTLTELAR